MSAIDRRLHPGCIPAGDAREAPAPDPTPATGRPPGDIHAHHRAIRTASLTAAVLALGVLAAPAASADDDDREGGGTTTVVLDPDVVPVLVDDLAVAPIEPAALTAPGGIAQVSFPITDVDDDEIEHGGGLQFQTLEDGTLRITEFEIELDEGVLEAEADLDGKQLGDVDVFALGAPQPIDGETPCDGTAAGLTLTEAAAGALGAPQFAGVFIGNACVVPEG